jgi:hypothetical protein
MGDLIGGLIYFGQQHKGPLVYMHLGTYIYISRLPPTFLRDMRVTCAIDPIVKKMFINFFVTKISTNLISRTTYA